MMLQQGLTQNLHSTQVCLQDLDYRQFKIQVAARNTRFLRNNQLHKNPYFVKFGSYRLKILPGVFDPSRGEGSQLMLRCKEHFAGCNVLDMGTGSGALAILAAETSDRVVAVDVNPTAVACAKLNCSRLDLDRKIEVREGDLFEPVAGNERFDLILFNPPFLEGKPKSLPDRAMFDEDYSSLTQFFRSAPGFLTATGRVLICFGSVGDLAYFENLIATACSDSRRIAATLVGGILFLVYELIWF